MNRFVELLPAQAARYGDREALRYRDYTTQQWTSLSWNRFSECAAIVASAFLHYGVEEQGRLAVFTQNCPEIFITHFGAFFNRAIPVPIYATSSHDEAAYIINDSGATILLVGDQRQAEIAVQLLDECDTLNLVVTLDPAVKVAGADERVITWQQLLEQGRQHQAEGRDTIAQRSQRSTPQDLMYLIYTSGTTGQPKGVMLQHSNFVAAMEAHAARIDVDPDTDVSLSFLPFSHIFELGWSMFCLMQGVRVAINYNPKEIQRAVKEVQPTCMCSVPRFWEKVYTAITDNIATAKPVVRMLFKRAIAVGKARNMKYVRLGKKPPLLIEKQYQYFESKVFKRLRAAIGIENGVVTPWSSYTVPEGVEVGDDIVYDDDGRNYTMNMTLAEMMRRSSNTGISMMAQESIGEERFAAGIDAFGIGHATGIDFPGEETGIVRSLEEYDGSSLGSMSFGQGLAIPMVQMVRAVGIVANGGIPSTPHFACFLNGERVEWPQGEQVISQETCDEVTQMMRVVVDEGTGIQADVEGYDVAGKTGTGEQADEEGGYREDAFVSSFVGFAPASDPEILVYVGLNNTPYLASGSAAPTFSSIMSEALTDMGIPPES